MSPEILPKERFPRGVADLARPPQQLFLWGLLPPPPWVSIVGTRYPTPESAAFAHELARDLGARGIVVASGGARGIDAAAHSGALEAQAATVVVAPSGFERPYPAAHAKLFERIVAAGGAFLSRVDGDIHAQRHVFFQRNQLLVACSEAVVVVEAPLKSGARNAAHWARKLGRPLWVVPQTPWNARGEGCIEELRLGARPLKCPQDVLQSLQARHWPPLWAADAVNPVAAVDALQGVLPFEPANAPKLQSESLQPAPAAHELGPDEHTGTWWGRSRHAVAAAFEGGARHPDQIQQLTGLPIGDVHALLGELDLDPRTKSNRR